MSRLSKMEAGHCPLLNINALCAIYVKSYLNVSQYNGEFMSFYQPVTETIHFSWPLLIKGILNTSPRP